MAIQQEREEGEETKVAASPSKLKLVARYAMLGIGPLVAIIALVIGVLAMNGNRSGEEQIGKAVARTERLEKDLEAARSELERLRLAAASEKSRLDEERQKQKELEDKFIRNISQLQTKAKIVPTLEQQLQPASAPAAVPPASATAAPAATSGPAGGDRKAGSQAQAIKEAIEKFNRQ